MVIYRYLSNEEIKGILYRAKVQLGQIPTAVQMASSKKYKKGEKYLHFFRDLKDLSIVQSLDNSPQGKFIGKFDIPMRFLLAGVGVGQYTGTPIEGTDKFVVMKEFAMELKYLKSQHLVDYVFDKDCDLTMEEVQEQFEEQEKELAEE